MPFYLLKVTKFLGKISQFEFLVMTEKNISAYKLFWSLNISDFNSFLHVKIAIPPQKSHPLFPISPPLTVEVLPSPPTFLKISLKAHPCLRYRKGDAHYAWGITRWLLIFVMYICLRPEATYDRNMKLAPETKYHIENKIAPKKVVNFVANMYWIIFLALPDLRSTISYLDPHCAKLLDYGPS